MRKISLMLLLTGVSVYAVAQKHPSRSDAHTKPMPLSYYTKHRTLSNDPVSFAEQTEQNRPSVFKHASRKPQSVNETPCGSAANLYGILNSGTTAVTFDQNLNAIVFTHRVDASKLGSHGSGTYEASISLDGGASWDTTKLIYGNAASSANGTRYPNGVIFNPAGNTALNNAYWVVNGPYTQGTATGKYLGWDSTAIGSMKFDSTNMSQLFWGNGRPNVLVEEATQNMVSCDDSTVHSVGDGYIYNSAGTGDTYLGTSVNTGKFNSTTGTFNWSQTLLRPHFVANSGVTSYDSIPQKLGDAGTAWSQDGKTGYTVIFGNLDSTDAVSSSNLNFVSYQPIVYKTTNSGATWTMMPVHNWDNDTTLVQYFPPAQDSNVVVPIWGIFYTVQGGDDDYDLVVDANNNLHIIGGIHGSTIANKDSSEYISYYLRGWVFDMYTTSSGGWAARAIDSLVASPTQVANTPGGWLANGTTDPLALGHRIQASRTSDGKKIFATWLDDYADYSGSGVDSIQLPDLFGQGYDVTTGIFTSVKSFTYNQNLPQTNQDYFVCVSDKPMVSGTTGNQTYRIPVVNVAPPSAASDGTTPVSFLYDTTDVYTDFDFNPASVPTIKPVNFSITQNFPNPYNGITRFGINMVKEGEVSVDVFNMVGEKVISMQPEKMGAGNHIISLNGSDLSSGVYFYRVTVDGSSLTQKMIVQQ